MEVAEATADSHIGVAADNFGPLRALGIRIAIDDFGTALLSPARLKQLKVNYIKIDRSFVHGFGNRDFDEAIVQAIVDQLTTRGLQATAEDVETPQRPGSLTRIGCDDYTPNSASKSRRTNHFDMQNYTVVSGALIQGGGNGAGRPNRKP